MFAVCSGDSIDMIGLPLYKGVRHGQGYCKVANGITCRGDHAQCATLKVYINGLVGREPATGHGYRLTQTGVRVVEPDSWPDGNVALKLEATTHPNSGQDIGARKCCWGYQRRTSRS